MKQTLAALKDFSASVDKRIYIWAGVVGIVMVGITGAGFMVGQAKQADFSGKQVFYADCAVMEKEYNPYVSRSGIDYSTYKVVTSCGEFMADPELFESAVKGEVYDLTATTGNWANKPTIISVELA